MDTITVCNIVIIIILYTFTVTYSLDMKRPYPKFIIQMFHQPIVKMVTYMTIYALSYLNPIASLLSLMIVILFHIDHYNLTKPIIS